MLSKLRQLLACQAASPATAPFSVDECIEIDFPHLSPSHALAVLEIIMPHCPIEWARHVNSEEARCWEEPIAWNALRARFLPERLFDFGLMIRSPHARLGAVTPSLLLIYVGADDAHQFRPQSGFPDACFIELSFNLSTVERPRRPTLVRDLHDFAAATAHAAATPHFSASIGPAYHTDSRLFTGPDLGPVRIDDTSVRWPPRNPLP